MFAEALSVRYCGGGDLYDYIVSMGCFSEDVSHRYFYQMLTAVNYIHSHNIVHRDLKPEVQIVCVLGEVPLFV